MPAAMAVELWIALDQRDRQEQFARDLHTLTLCAAWGGKPGRRPTPREYGILE